MRKYGVVGVFDENPFRCEASLLIASYTNGILLKKKAI